MRRVVWLALMVVGIIGCGPSTPTLNVVRHEDFKGWNYDEEPHYSSDELNAQYRAVFNNARDATRELLIGDWSGPEFRLMLEKFNMFELYNNVPGDGDPSTWYMTGKWELARNGKITLTAEDLPGNLPEEVSKLVKGKKITIEYAIVNGNMLFKPFLYFDGVPLNFALPE